MLRSPRPGGADSPPLVQPILDPPLLGPPAVPPATRGPEGVDSVQHCRLPPFWRRNPELWFLQVEAVFQALRVRSGDTKFHLVVSLLDAESLQDLADIIRNPPEDRKYEALKAAILERLADSADQQLLQLLTQLELGDRKPSQLLRQMRALAGTRVSSDVLRVRWLDLLPVGIQRILKVLKSHDLDELASAADELIIRGPGVMAAEPWPPRSGTTCLASGSTALRAAAPGPDSDSGDIRALLGQMIALQREILERLPPRMDRARSNTRRSSRSRSPAATPNARVCHYHQRWGANARRCITPCSFAGASSVASSTPGN